MGTNLAVATNSAEPALKTGQPVEAAGSPQAKSQRQPELDALRGLLLIWMTLTHLPTHVSVYSNQPLGFVSAAEGFIFLSALLCGRVFGRKMDEAGFSMVWNRLRMRALRLYGYHLILLTVAFTVIAFLAVRTKQPSLQGLIDFYLAHPVRGIIASLLLIYRPPLLDILPMYILFLLATPAVLYIGKRWGWKVIVLPSLLVWFAAQLGLRAWMYNATIQTWRIDIPFSALGAFDLYAWQLLWAMGLWIGSGRPRLIPLEVAHKVAFAFAALVAVFFCYARHSFLWDPLNNGGWLVLTDKWHLGAFRLLNFAALATLFSAVQDRLAKWAILGPLVILGRASLEVFCAHLLVCFAALALVDDGSKLNVLEQTVMVASAILVLYGVGRLFSKERRSGIRPRRED